MPDVSHHPVLDARELLIVGGEIVDSTGRRHADVRVAGGEVAEVGAGLDPDSADLVVDAAGCLVAPGLVDLHTHLREPGDELAETIETGARAAAIGGYTAVVAMPNTRPALDDATVVGSVLARGARSICDVASAATITKERGGRELSPMGELYDLGVRIFTDDGDCIDDAGVMRNAMAYSTALPGAVIAQHAEDAALARGGHMHEGEWSSRLGIPGRPSAAESVVVARDIELAKLTGARLHVLHCSTAESVQLIREAKSAGVPVTAEVAPHHFTLTDAECATFDPLFKVHPPLRTDADIAALIAGLVDGTIDAIATDHAPHPAEAKDQPFEEAPPGMLGLETALALTFTELVEPGHLTVEEAFGLLSWNPARIAGLEDHGQPVGPGSPANLCVVDPEASWEVDPAGLASRSRNTPYVGRKLNGRVRHTVLRGEAVVIDGEAQR
ncbi:MAG: dihydroorotase [Acidimicrobiia bacterium]